MGMVEIETNSLIPYSLGNELSSDSFRSGQFDNTYLLASQRYTNFYRNYVKPRIMMYRGWIEGFHNKEYGIIPTHFLQRIGNGIVNTIFSKKSVLNTTDKGTKDIINQKFKYAKFDATVKEAYRFGIEGGAGLIKWNKDGNNNLIAESVQMDKFFIMVDGYGNIERVKAFLATYHDTIYANKEFYICEERFFRYARIGIEMKRFPMVHYTVYTTTTDINYEATPRAEESIRWEDVPGEIQRMIKNDYGEIMIDNVESGRLTDFKNCKLLPFNDDLGCRLIKFTEGIPAYPKIPFGQPLADILMNENYAYEQLKSFERFEVYAARSRIMLSKGFTNPNDPESKKNALDPMIFEYWETLQGEATDKKPGVLQPDLRADKIQLQKANILNDTGFALGMSSSTVAAWLSEGSTQKTATEIENEKTKTQTFINSKISIIQEPLQEMIDMYFHFYGVSAPELIIVPETQAIRSESIKLYSELFDKGQITADMLAREILGPCSQEEQDDLKKFIELNQEKKEAMAQPMIVPVG